MATTFFRLLILTFCLGSSVSFVLPNRYQNVSSASLYIDRLCGYDLTKLWLDVVIVIDNSKGMTDEGMTSVSADIASIFVGNLQLGISSTEPRTTRVALVTYSGSANVIADLNQFQSVDELTKFVFSTLTQVSTDERSYLQTGLVAAEKLLEEQSFGTQRDHYRKLVIVYASVYRGTGEQNPVPTANRLKESGISIATVAYGQDDDNRYLEGLSDIASSGFNFTNRENTVGELQDCMVQVNCYCQNNWFQMRENYTNSNSFRYGICVNAIAFEAIWTAAKLSCRNHKKNAYLVNEYTKLKHDFVLEVVKNTNGFEQPYIYFIGLSYSAGSWNWEQPDGQPTVKLQNFDNWNPGFPEPSSTKPVAFAEQVSSSDESTFWMNTSRNVAEFYVCEMATCDSTNYCEQDNV